MRVRVPRCQRGRVVNAVFTFARYADAMTAPIPSSLERLASFSAGWLAIAAMLTDLAFETDTRGRFTAFGPGAALGQPQARLLGTELVALLATAEREARAEELRRIITTICT